MSNAACPPAPFEFPRRTAGAGGVWRALRRGLFVTVGGAVILLGFVISPLPGPMGLPVAVAGLVIVLRNATWAKRLFVRAQRRWPNWIYPVRRLMRPKPEIAPVFWKMMLRTEQLISRSRLKILKALRRRAMRRQG